MQALIVAGLVLGSGLYAWWTLCPRAWRQGLARWLLGRPGLSRWRALQVAAQPGAPAGCSGCEGRCVAPPPDTMGGGPSAPTRVIAVMPVRDGQRQPPSPPTIRP